MRDFILQNFEHFLCAALLIAKLGDNISTRLVTPNLTLEANPIARKLRWGFIWFTLVVCLVPYVSTTLAVALLPSFLLVSASNFGKVWMARTLGEEEMRRLLLAIARRSRIGSALWPLGISMLFLASLGGLLILFYPDPYGDWSFWIGIGVVMYSFVMILYGTLALRRIFRQVQAEPS